MESYKKVWDTAAVAGYVKQKKSKEELQKEEKRRKHLLHNGPKFTSYDSWLKSITAKLRNEKKKAMAEKEALEGSR